MIRVSWAEKQPGDVLFVYDPESPLSIAIAEAEREMLPGQGFTPSHAAIVGFNDTVVESIIDRKHNSVAAVNPISKYDGLAARELVEVWRPEGTPTQKWAALTNYIADYKSKAYGLLDLFGFLYEAAVKFFFKKTVDNPIEASFVCSMGVLLYLRDLWIAVPDLRWVNDIKVRDCYPSLLRFYCKQNERGEADAAA